MTALPNDLRQRVIDTVALYKSKAEEIYRRQFAPITTKFNVGGGRVAGYARCDSRVVDFNVGFLVKQPEPFIADTVPHEVAHIITHDVYGRDVSAHGPEWKSVMYRFGVTPERCHRYEKPDGWKPGAKKAVIEVTCQLCNRKYQVTRKVANTIAWRRCRCGASSSLKVTKDQATTIALAVAKSTTSFSSPAAVEPGAAKYAFTPVMSKMDKCVVIYVCHAGSWSRQQLIQEFITQAGCTPAGAATYYATIKAKYR